MGFLFTWGMSTYLLDKGYWTILIVVFLRYFVIAAVAFAIFYLVKKQAWHFKKIQSRFPAGQDYAREILYSILTAFIFAAIGYIVFFTALTAYTQAYFNVAERGVPYLIFSVLLIIVIHDTYFYWTH